MEFRVTLHPAETRKKQKLEDESPVALVSDLFSGGNTLPLQQASVVLDKGHSPGSLTLSWNIHDKNFAEAVLARLAPHFVESL